MEEYIKAKCPYDGTRLRIPNKPDKTFKCPVCKRDIPFSQFNLVTATPKSDSEPTAECTEVSTHILLGTNQRSSNVNATDTNSTIGVLFLVGSDTQYQLKLGRNIIGRKAKLSSADIQIDTANKRSLSREHIIIEVKKVKGKGIVHFVSLYKQVVNKTFIDNVPLLYGNCIVLAHGDTIKLPDVALRFEIPTTK